MPVARRFRCPRLTERSGFTLSEVLVVSVVGSLLIIITATVLIPQLRMHQRLEGRSRLQERWARLNMLLDTEIQEAHNLVEIPNGLRLIICEPAEEFYTATARCTDGYLGSTTRGGTPGNDIVIEYRWNASAKTLTRTGPSIDRAGRLLPNTNDTSVVSTGVESFTVSLNKPRVNYSLTFSDPLDPDGARLTQQSSAASNQIQPH